MVKWWDTELCNRVVDRCLQLHGGYGYMREYPVARAFADARVQTIFGGTTEIMKEIIGRGLGVSPAIRCPIASRCPPGISITKSRRPHGWSVSGVVMGIPRRWHSACSPSTSVTPR